MTHDYQDALKAVNDWLESYTDDPDTVLRYCPEIQMALEVAERFTWQPIETAPHDEPVLVHQDHNCWKHGIQFVARLSWMDGAHRWFTAKGYLDKDAVTAWMPLPKPPAAPESDV